MLDEGPVREFVHDDDRAARERGKIPPAQSASASPYRRLRRRMRAVCFLTPAACRMRSVCRCRARERRRDIFARSFGKAEFSLRQAGRADEAHRLFGDERALPVLVLIVHRRLVGENDVEPVVAKPGKKIQESSRLDDDFDVARPSNGRKQFDLEVAGKRRNRADAQRLPRGGPSPSKVLRNSSPNLKRAFA